MSLKSYSNVVCVVLYSETDQSVIILRFLITINNKMAAKHFSSQTKSSSAKHTSLTPCNMHLTVCNMQNILHSFSSVS